VQVEPFVHQLSSLCRAHVTRAKWVFVPSHALGYTLGERLAREGTNWLNLRFVTPLDIALRMGAPFLVERGIDPSEDGLGPALAMRLMLELPEGAGYFRPLADQPSMAQALWSTIRELRMAGIRSTDLKPEAFASPAKHAELRALLESYEQLLVHEKRGDMAVVFEEALKHRDWCPIQDQDCWTELPDHVWSPLQRRLIDAMPGERIVPRALEVAGATIPRRLVGPCERVAPDPATNPLAFLMAPARGPRAQQASRIALFHAGGHEAEVEEVFRRILTSGAPLDRVEIACGSQDHVSLAWEKALRHDWPVTLGPGIAATCTRPGRAILGFCTWIESDFAAGHFRRLLQSGDMGVEADDEGFTAGEAARILARAEAGWGRATYGLSLGRLQKEYESRAADENEADDEREDAREKAGLTAKVRAWMEALVLGVPVAGDDNTVPLQSVVTAALNFIVHTTARKSALDHRAGAALEEYVADLESLGDFSCTLFEALRFIRERVQGLTVAAERPRAGHLYVSSLSRFGDSGRPHLYVVGLEEGRVFPTGAEDPVLLDAERAAISPDLRTSTDRIDESVYAVLSRLARCGSVTAEAVEVGSTVASISDRLEERVLGVGSWRLGVDRCHARVTFSFSCRDTREFRETYASWLMLQAFRLQQGDSSLSYQDMKKALGDPVSIVPADRTHAPTSLGWWVRSVVGTDGDGVKRIVATFEPLGRGREAIAARESEAFTEFDGHVPAAGKVLDPCAADRVFSVTELESAAGCPYRFFLKRGLRVRPVEDGERDRDVWLDPLTRGSELHFIYASLLRRCRDEGRRANARKDRDWIVRLAQERLDDLNREMPPATAEILERESREFLADVELFLEKECEDSDIEPTGFEVTFGRPLGDDEDPLASEHAVEVELDEGVAIRIAGRIDRIDRLGSGKFQVLDYKTGGYWADSYKGTFRGGRLLQHALYGLAAVQLLKRLHRQPKVAQGVYYFSSRKGRQERREIAAPSREAIAAVLADLREVIRTGAFIHSPEKKDDCKWCDFEAACGSDANEQAKAKLGDRKLVAYGRLGAHE
jgi:ATP-dependent helicase/nuclease subunit B